MAEVKDMSIHLTAEKLTAELKDMDIYKGFYENLQVSQKIHIWKILLKKKLITSILYHV